MKRIISVILLLIIFIIASQSISAKQVPINGQYTYNSQKKPVPIPSAYSVQKELTSKDFDCGELKEPSDLYISKDGLLYILDTGNNRIVVLDKTLKFKKEIKTFIDENNEELNFKKPEGMHIDEEKKRIYLADGGNNRILVADIDTLKLSHLILAPPISHFSNNASFIPRKIAVDSTERLYIACFDIKEGLLQLDLQGNFLGFVGAPPVKYNIAQIFWRQFLSKKARAKQIQFVPVNFNSVTADKNGFIYATLATTDKDIKQKLRKINPTGEDILRRNGIFDIVGDVDEELINSNNPEDMGSLFCDVATINGDTYFVLDSTRNRIFMYDYDGNLLCVFGNKGNVTGSFTKPVAISLYNNKLFVLDSVRMSITVFESTVYGQGIIDARLAYKEGDYKKSKEIWENVLTLNYNSEFAHIGLGKILYREGKYKEAMQHFKIGDSRIEYSRAFAKYRINFVANNFIIIAFSIILLITILLVMFFYKTSDKYKARPSNGRLWSKIKYSMHIIIHPFDGFWDMKHENRGSVLASTVLFIVFILSSIVKSQYTGYVFSTENIIDVDVFGEIITILIIMALWTISNYSISQWIYGEGTYLDVYMYSCYSLVPLVIFNILGVALSNVLLISESNFVSTIFTIGIVWSLLLIFFGNITLHRYSLSTGTKHIIAICLQIAVMLFIGLVIVELYQQIKDFIVTIYCEIVLRS